MINIDPRNFFIDTVHTTLSTAGTQYTVQKRMPDHNFLVISVRPLLYDTQGAIITSVEARGLVTVSIEDYRGAQNRYTKDAIDIFSFEGLEQALGWQGWLFPRYQDINFHFNTTAVNSQPTGAVTVQLNLIGYLDRPLQQESLL